MASLQKKGNSWYGQFYWRDERFTFAIGRVTEPQAQAQATKAGEIVDLLQRGVLKIPARFPEMQRRYRHMTPELKGRAVAAVFG